MVGTYVWNGFVNAVRKRAALRAGRFRICPAAGLWSSRKGYPAVGTFLLKQYLYLFPFCVMRQDKCSNISIVCVVFFF